MDLEFVRDNYRIVKHREPQFLLAGSSKFTTMSGRKKKKIKMWETVISDRKGVCIKVKKRVIVF